MLTVFVGPVGTCFSTVGSEVFAVPAVLCAWTIVAVTSRLAVSGWEGPQAASSNETQAAITYVLR